MKVRDSKTVTEEKAYWLLPAGVSGATYREVSDIDFTFGNDEEEVVGYINLILFVATNTSEICE